MPTPKANPTPSTPSPSTPQGHPLRVACLGAGYFARFHHDAWRRIANAQLQAIADRNKAKAEQSIKGTEQAYASLDDMIAGEKIDLLDIATPPESHADAINYALSQGIKTIICQKPFCANLAEATAVTALAKDHHANLIIHDNFRFQPWYRLIKNQMDQGGIGQVMQSSFRLRPGDGQGDDAYLDRQPYFQTMERFLIHETGIHWLDVFSYLHGDVTHVYADLRRLNPAIAGEDAGIVILTHRNGIRSVFDGNRLVDHGAENPRLTMGEAIIEGDQGVLRLDGYGQVFLRLKDQTAEHCLMGQQPYAGFGGDCVHALQSHVIDHFTTGGALENTADAYLNRLHLEQAVYRSAQEGRQITLSENDEPHRV